MAHYKQGIYKPKNPEKYKGNPTGICFRSSYEFRMFFWLDNHPEVISWSSEEFAISYRDPTTGRSRRYFPDIFFTVKSGKKYLVEIKPYAETIPPKMSPCKNGKPRKSDMRKAMTFAINQAKWEAAKLLCEKKNWEWTIITEKNLPK